MGMEMELVSRSNVPSDLSPDTVLPVRHFPNNAKRSTNEALRRDEVLRVREAFTEISFRRYRSSSCRSPSGPAGLGGNLDVQLKRGSVYESSRELRRMNKADSNEARKKIECSRGSDTSLSVQAVESMCSDEENVVKRRQSMYGQKPATEACSSSDFIEICPSLGNRKKHIAGRCEPGHRPLSDDNDLLKRDLAMTCHNSLSAKLDMTPPSPTSESDASSKASAKSRFGPIKKMFDPFMNSKSQSCPPRCTTEPSNVKTDTVANMCRNQTLRKSLLHDFSHTVKASDFESQFGTKDHHPSLLACSPVHLHGCLKLDIKHGAPFYEFSLNSLKEVFVAKTWKSNNAFNWVYTFHSCSIRKRSNASGWGLTEGNKESLVVGQMQVSCYLRSESREERESDNSVVTDFVLYDIAHARQCVSAFPAEEAVNPSNSGTCLGSGARKVHDVSDVAHHKNSCKQAFHEGTDIFSNPYPCASGLLHPGLEIATIIVELPFAKRESLKYKRGDANDEKKHLNLLSLPLGEQMTNEFAYRDSAKVNVVIPSGHHSLATEESRFPSSLLGRWRFGGGCDCGGWDMACPLTVLGNPRIRSADIQLLDNRQPLELFVEGTKDKMPAVSLTMIEKGQYDVVFHAQLSTLQAFSICVAILHTTEASGSCCGNELSRQLMECCSLKVLMEDEGKHLVEAPRKMQETHHSYTCKPPFSPIARV